VGLATVGSPFNFRGRPRLPDIFADELTLDSDVDRPCDVTDAGTVDEEDDETLVVEPEVDELMDGGGLEGCVTVDGDEEADDLLRLCATSAAWRARSRDALSHALI